MAWREQYDRVLRARVRVTEHYAVKAGYKTFGGDDFQRFRDDILHCIQDIFHLRDWVKNDQSVDVDLGVLKTLFIGDPVCSPYLHMARDLANGSKHLVLDRARSSEVDIAISPTGSVDWTPAGNMEDGVIAQALQIEVGSGDGVTRMDALAFIDACMQEWDEFLRGEGLIAPE
jgi:hypothetical protein